MADGLKEWKKPVVTEVTPKKLDELKPPVLEKAKEKVALTPKEKADIREAIGKCTTFKEAEELRHYLQTVNTHVKTGPEELFARPRIEIKAS